MSRGRSKAALGLSLALVACASSAGEPKGESVDAAVVGDATAPFGPGTPDAGPGATDAEASEGTPDMDAPAPPDAFVAPGPTEAECAPLAPCGRGCVDLATDPTSCGVCGRTCVVPGALATCVAGECAAGACDPGFADANGDPDDGCEQEVLCAEGTPCASACGTEGRLTCAGAAPECRPPAEACNALDDDCNGTCDEGGLPGCRVPVHRGVGDGHLYHTDLGAVQAPPFRLETAAFFHLYREGAQGMRPVFLCRKGDGKRFLTSDQACEVGVAPEATLGFWSPTPLCGAVPLYRLYSGASSDHFFTTSAPERDNAVATYGYRDEGVPGYVWPGP